MVNSWITWITIYEWIKTGDEIAKIRSDSLFQEAYEYQNLGLTPVISPIAISEESEFLNVDGDRAAAYIAGSVGCDKEA